MWRVVPWPQMTISRLRHEKHSGSASIDLTDWSNSHRFVVSSTGLPQPGQRHFTVSPSFKVTVSLSFVPAKPSASRWYSHCEGHVLQENAS